MSARRSPVLSLSKRARAGRRLAAVPADRRADIGGAPVMQQAGAARQRPRQAGERRGAPFARRGAGHAGGIGEAVAHVVQQHVGEQRGAAAVLGGQVWAMAGGAAGSGEAGARRACPVRCAGTSSPRR